MHPRSDRLRGALLLPAAAAAAAAGGAQAVDAAAAECPVKIAEGVTGRFDQTPADPFVDYVQAS